MQKLSTLFASTAASTVLLWAAPSINGAQAASIGSTIDFSSLNLNGSASVVVEETEPPILRLTPSTSFQAGSAFLETPIAIDDDTSFWTQFSFQISNAGGVESADGLAFLLQNDPAGPGAMGGSGGNIGYQGISPSLVIEFDTFLGSGIGDPSGNHIGINLNGNLTSIGTAEAGFPALDSGEVFHAWIDYDGKTDQLEIFLSNTENQPLTPILSLAGLELPSVLGDQAFAGFTSGTGGGFAEHDVLTWEFETGSKTPEPSSLLSLVVLALAAGTGLKRQPR